MDGEELARKFVIESRGGVISSLSDGPVPDGAVRLDGVVLPGFVNAHSHAFHRLLRGRTHRRRGDFWIWRDLMYEVAASLTPESYERLGTAVFVEMAMAGITTVGEFHYVHHQSDGVPYSDPNEMGHALVRAARAVGIRINLLDAGYFTAGFDDRPLHPVQERFRDHSLDGWLERVSALRARYESERDVRIGLAPHSVRAVPPPMLKDLGGRSLVDTPVHIHVSEQPAENRECLEATGLTPTGLLEQSGLIGPQTTLVHATHLTRQDIEAVGSAGATVCYCATTERDLADGIGPAHELSGAGANLCVGSDSHAIIDMLEEARGLEMHTRLASGQRGNFSSGELLSALTHHGSASLGFPGGGLEVGSPADFVVIDTDSPRLAGMGADPTLDSIVFAASADDVSDVYVSGRKIVDHGSHDLWPAAKRALDELEPRQ